MPLRKRQSAAAEASQNGVGLPSLFPKPIQPGVRTLGGILGFGARVGSGILGAEGFLPGAAISGAGEGLAEFLEGSLDRKTTPTRVGMEAGIGAIPFGKVASAGRTALAAGKTALLGGGGDLGRQWAEGNFDAPDATPTNPNPKAPGLDVGRLSLATLLGGAGGAIYSKLTPRVKAPAPEPVIIESSGAVPRSVAPNGLGTVPPKNDLPKGKVDFTHQDQASIPAGGTAHSAGRALPSTDSYSGGVSEIRGLPTGSGIPTVLSGPRKLAGRVPYGKIDDETGLIADLESQFSQAMNTSDTRYAVLAKKAKADAARNLIQRRRIAAGVEPETSFSSTISSETPTGVKETMTTKFRAPKVDEDADAAAGVVGDLAKTFAQGNEVVPEMMDEAQRVVQGVNARVAERLKNLDGKALQYFNHLRNVEGDSDSAAYKLAYREMVERKGRISRPLPQVAAAAEESAAPQVDDLQKLLSGPTAKEVLEQSTHPSFYDEGVEGLENAADAAMRRQSVHPSFYDEGFEGLENAVKPRGTPPPAAQAKLAEAAQTYQPEALEELKRLSALYNDPNVSKAGKKELGKQLRQLAQFMKPPSARGNKGAASVEAMLSTIFGVAGGLAGAAADASTGDDPAWDGALSGALVGVGIPHLPKALSSLRSQIDPTNEAKVTSAAKAFVNKLPQIQRFSLLMNPQGAEQTMGGIPTPIPALAMNAIAGPYGAVLTHAIKTVLQEGTLDGRGGRLLKAAWNPVKFVKGWWQSSDEAWEALVHGEEGRAANLSTIDPNSVKDKLLSYPGQLMTMGDTYARKLLTEAGFSPEEARRATLTSEPGKAWRGLSNVGKNNPLVQMMFPFRRTPVNIVEQGFETTPGLRQIGQAFGITEPGGGTEAIVDQGLGAVAGLGSYALASNIDDDQSRRNVRRVVSNAAGRYSLPAQIGYMLGDANARDLKGIKSVVNEQNLKNLFPLPSLEVPVDMLVKGANIGTGNVDSPADFIPESMKLKALRQWLGDLSPQSRRYLGVQSQQPRGLRKRGARSTSR
jgi:hypothetical protein